jgi:hypothetical protein
MIKASTKSFSQATYIDMEERKVKMECIGEAGIDRIENAATLPPPTHCSMVGKTFSGNKSPTHLLVCTAC